MLLADKKYFDPPVSEASRGVSVEGYNQLHPPKSNVIIIYHQNILVFILLCQKPLKLGKEKI